MPRPKRGTKRQTVEAVQLFGSPEMRDKWEDRVIELVVEGHTPRAAERIAAEEAIKRGPR